jgi:hypothetical protein
MKINIFYFIFIHFFIYCNKNNIQYLYHGSHVQNIDYLKSFSLSKREKNDNPRIYATHLYALATCFLFKHDDSWTRLSISTRTEEEPIIYLVIGDEKKFNECNKKGSIYTITSDHFMYDENKGLGEYEWYTEKPSIRVISEEKIENILDALVNAGVKVYFLSNKNFNIFSELKSFSERYDFLQNNTRFDGKIYKKKSMYDILKDIWLYFIK